MTLNIVEFTEIVESEYLSYIEEWEQSNEDIVPSATKRNNLKYEVLLKKWHDDKSDDMYNKGFVPSTLYFLINENKRILGAIHLRHKLNERLMKNGGNIGYGVRPSERGHGYASLMLNLLLSRLKDDGFDKVLLTCDDDNYPSAKTIENNQGILKDKIEFEGVLTRRYWIYL